LKLHCMLYSINENEHETRINEALQIVELSDRKNDLLKKFSGGMRRRLEIARALLHKPKILFLDEPTLGLDPNARKLLWNYILKLKKDLKMTILLTTHYMEEAEKLADRICIINKGKVIALGKVQDLLSMESQNFIFLELNKPLNEKVFEEIKKDPFVTHLEYDSSALILRIITKNVTKTLFKLLKLFEDKDIKNLKIKEHTLEELFIKLTGKTFSEQEENNTWFDKVIQQEVLKDT
ncbi:MAG: ATP-binding cassette domain-containing protein, partial [Pseudothermotoga sp.]|nr:ATP-binding cassette domain-containing protein [Pseudothermotoga sp.]